MHTVTQVEKHRTIGPYMTIQNVHTLTGTHKHTRTHSVPNLLLKSNISLTNLLKVLHTTASQREYREGSEKRTD